MQERVFFEDQDIRITASDIRCKQLTIRTSSVTSVSIASARPGKWAPVIFLLLLIPPGFLLLSISVFFRITPVVFLPVFISFAPFCFLWFLRVSRLYLQTSGGPVVLASKIELSDPSATLARYQMIKNSLEQAMRAAQATRIQV